MVVQLSDIDYDLPEELIAQVPVEPREPYDGFAKDWIAHQLEGCGAVTINAPFQPEKLYVDVLFVPQRPPPNALLAQMVSVGQRAVRPSAARPSLSAGRKGHAH